MIFNWNNLDMIEVVLVICVVTEILNELLYLFFGLQIFNVFLDQSNLIIAYSDSCTIGIVIFTLSPNSISYRIYLVLTLSNSSGVYLIISPCACKSNLIYPGVLGRSNNPYTLHCSPFSTAYFIYLTSSSLFYFRL